MRSPKYFPDFLGLLRNKFDSVAISHCTPGNVLGGEFVEEIEPLDMTGKKKELRWECLQFLPEPLDVAHQRQPNDRRGPRH